MQLYLMEVKRLVPIFQLTHFRLIDDQLCCFQSNRTVLSNTDLDIFNGQTVYFILKPPQVIKSRTCFKKADRPGTLLKQHCSIKCSDNSTALLNKISFLEDLFVVLFSSK